MTLDARTVELRWRDQIIPLNQWADDDLGLYAYTVENGSLVVDYELRPNAGLVDIILHRLNGEPPHRELPATAIIDGLLHLRPARSLAPQTVPAGLLALIVWAEWIAADGNL